MSDLEKASKIEIAEADLKTLLERVRHEKQSVRLYEKGRPVADLVPIQSRHELPPVRPELKVSFASGYDPTEPLDEDEWPSEFR